MSMVVLQHRACRWLRHLSWLQPLHRPPLPPLRSIFSPTPHLITGPAEWTSARTTNDGCCNSIPVHSLLCNALFITEQQHCFGGYCQTRVTRISRPCLPRSALGNAQGLFKILLKPGRRKKIITTHLKILYKNLP
jgi:hypothetical protein